MNKLVLLIFVITTISFSQENYSEKKKNSIFFEAGGNGIVASLNYEHNIFKNVGLRIGFGSALIEGRIYPAMINFYKGDENLFEFGVGVVYYEKTEGWFSSDESLCISSTIGYKKYPFEGLLFRASFTPLYVIKSDRFIPFVGISFGFVF